MKYINDKVTKKVKKKLKDDVLLVKADKGNAIVTIKKEDYVKNRTFSKLKCV